MNFIKSSMEFVVGTFSSGQGADAACGETAAAGVVAWADACFDVTANIAEPNIAEPNISANGGTGIDVRCMGSSKSKGV
jgi:hypothetical protein